jgi:hypothetical protein
MAQLRFFNTTGPCNPEKHYMLPPEERLVGAQWQNPDGTLDMDGLPWDERITWTKEGEVTVVGC